MGEDTEGMVESSAKLRDLVKGMTGFDIMEDEQTFKSIYEIIVGIGEKWKDLSDIQQASLLEKLAGKTQANTLASALNNIDILKEAYESAEESAGSALQEQERFEEGLQYHLNQFNIAREALSHNIMDSELVKFFVDLGTIGVKAIDAVTQAVGGLSVAISGLMLARGLASGQGILSLFNSLGSVLSELVFVNGSIALESAGLTTMADGLLGIGAAVPHVAMAVAAITALSAVLTAVYKKYDDSVHKYEKSSQALDKATSSLTEKKNEIDDLNSKYEDLQKQIETLNSLDGAKLARDGEKERLEAESKELQRQITLKEAAAKLDAAEAYNASKEVFDSTVQGHDSFDVSAVRAGMTRSEYLHSIGLESSASPRLNIKDAIPAEFKYYQALLEQRKQIEEDIDKLSTDEDGKHNSEKAKENSDEINELNKQIQQNEQATTASKQSIIEWSNSLQEAAESIKTYEEYGYILTDDDRATIQLAQSTREQVDAMLESEQATGGAADAQGKLANSIIKTSEQMTKQKAKIDQLLADYKEIQQLSLGSDGVDVELDDEQLKKYGAALEYVNGVYQLNQEKLLELANQRNQTEIDSLNNLKKQASLQYLQNIQDIERYNELLAEGQKTLENGDSIESHIANLKNDNAALLQQTDIYSYYINQLENVTSAYQRWLNVSGQEVDSERFTGVQDASKSALDIIKSGKVGTEKYQVALDFLIPDGVDREDADAVKKYINKNITPYFTEDETGIKKFLKEASSEAKGIFSYDSKSGEYTLNEGMTTEEIMKRMGWSEDVVRAMFDQLKVYGADFEWDVEGLHTTEEQLMHTESELEKLNQEKEKYNNEEFSEENEKKIEELNEKIEEATKHSKELRDELKQSTVEKIDKKIEENGGLQTLWGETKNSGKDPKQISQELVKMLDISSPIELQLYTEDAEEKVRNLQTEIQKLYEQLGKGSITQEEFNTKLGEKTADLETKEMTLELLQQVILEDAGITTEETVKGISSTLDTVKGLLDNIYGVLSKDNPGDNGQQQDNNGNKPPAAEQKTPAEARGSSGRDGNRHQGGSQRPLPDIEQKVKVDTSEADKNLAATKQQANETKGAIQDIDRMNPYVNINGNFDSIRSQATNLYNYIKGLFSGAFGATRDYTGDTKLGGRSGRAKGNAFARGNDIVGEQGRELVVDPNRGIWYTVGDSGTEMIDLPKDAIVYSHNQTEALLKSGVTTRGKSRGRSFAEGTKYSPTPEEMKKYIWGNIDLQHRQPYFYTDEDGWDHVNTVLGAHKFSRGLHFALAGLAQGDEVYQIDDGALQWYADQLTAQSLDPDTILSLDKQGFTDDAGNWLHDLVAYVGTNAEEAERISQIMHVISDEYERSIGTYARGNAFANGTLVGERGRELVVDPNTGRWYTVGDYGSEMINLPKDAIVYNHQQTEDLLKNGHTGRGHSTGASFAEGNAYVHVKGIDANSADGVKGNRGFRFQGGASVGASKAAANAAKSAEKAAKGAKDAADEAKTTIDWIDRAIEYQTREIKKWKDIVDDEYEPYENRFDALDQYTEQLIDQQEVLYQAIERRNEKFEEDAQKLRDAIGEEKAEVILERVVKGDVDPLEWLEKFEDEFGKENAEKYYKMVVELQTDQKNIESADDAYRDNIKEQREAEQERYKMRLNIIKAEKENLDYEMDVLQHNLDMKDILGKMVVEQDYQDMIDQSEEIASNLREQLEVLEEQADSLDPTSEAYASVQSDIHSIKKDLLECEKNQAEWNDKIMRLPIERLDKYIGMLENIKKDLQNWISERDTLNIETLGQTMSAQFSNLKDIAKAYQDQEQKWFKLRANYEWGSDKYEEATNEIQNCQDSISSIVQEMEELTAQFLKLPIDKISKINDKLQNINSAEQRVLDDYDTALSAVLSKFDQLIDKRNDEIDILNKRYDEMIKPYQDQLDLLNEQNEAKQMQYNIDKAQYDLDKARQQKNVQVVRNGRIEYDSDIDALKSAQDNLNNAKHDKAVYDLQQQIDALEKERDAKIEPLEKEIDKLEDARNRWQTFEDERTFEKEAAEAVRLLGANWEKAIEGTITNPHSDDREYDIFSKRHIELDREITATEKQMEMNDKMMDLMTRYSDAYMSGEMTLDELKSQYAKLFADYQSGGGLVSQEALAAELAFNKAKDMADALAKNNIATTEQYKLFGDTKRLDEIGSYTETYKGLQKTWDQMAADIKAQTEELKRLYELAEQIAGQRKSSGGSRRGGGDSDGGGGEWSKNPTGYGAHTKYNDSDHTVYVDSGKETSVSANSVEVHAEKMDTSHAATGPASDRSVKTSGKGPASEAFADGLAKGMVGGLNPSEKFKKLQAMGLKALEPDEIPAFLHVGEGVVNSIQQGNILKSVASAFNAGVMSSIPTDAVKSVENNYTFDCQFGDFILPNVEDTNGFANAMKNNFESIMNQQFSKIF